MKKNDFQTFRTSDYEHRPSSVLLTRTVVCYGRDIYLKLDAHANLEFAVCARSKVLYKGMAIYNFLIFGLSPNATQGKDINLM